MLKRYDAGSGVLLDANFLAHLSSCERCRRFIPEKPNTASEMCMEGAVLWKRDNVTAPAREAPMRSESFTSKANVRKAMRYK